MSARFEALFERAREDRKLLACGLVAGDPHLDATGEFLDVFVSSGVDVIELILPFSDPTYHGRVIHRACTRALREGVDWENLAELVAGFREAHPDTAMIVSSYYNRILSVGLDVCATLLGEAGVDGVMVPDLPWDEAGPLEERMLERGVSPVFMIAPTTSDARRDAIVASASAPLIWTGHAGGELVETDEAQQARLREACERSEVPILAAMRISSGEDARRVAPQADGVIATSSVTWLIEGRGPDVTERIADFIAQLRDGIDSVQ